MCSAHQLLPGMPHQSCPSLACRLENTLAAHDLDPQAPTCSQMPQTQVQCSTGLSPQMATPSGLAHLPAQARCPRHTVPRLRSTPASLQGPTRHLGDVVWHFSLRHKNKHRRAHRSQHGQRESVSI